MRLNEMHLFGERPSRWRDTDAGFFRIGGRGVHNGGGADRAQPGPSGLGAATTDYERALIERWLTQIDVLFDGNGGRD